VNVAVTAPPRPDQAAPSPVVRHARAATAVVFVIHGCVTGSFAARIPWIASHVGVGVGGLGVALLMPAVGAMLAMPFSGRAAYRYSLRPFVTVSIVAWCCALVLPALPTSLGLLCVVLLVCGAAAALETWR
jgi:predicted MFS family arabinose efflux permease